MIFCVLVCFYTVRMAVMLVHFIKMYRQVFRNSGESLQKNIWKSAEGVRSICNAVNLSGKRMEEREHVYTNQQLYHLV
mgnify:FL=1